MIKFRALMQAIQQSISDASKAIEAQGLKHLDDFFEPSDNNEDGSTHRPKMVSMEFPNKTAEGVEIVKAKVPLITLSPISTQKITEVKFTTRLNVTTGEDDEVFVSFPSKSSGLLGRRNTSLGNTRIEITLKGSEPPEGLQKVIEGYERALRAQIPN